MAKPEVINLHILGFFNDRLADIAKLDEFLTIQKPDEKDSIVQTKKSLKRKLALVSTKKRTSSYMRYKLPRLQSNKKSKRSKDNLLKCRKERRNRCLLNKLHCIHDIEAKELSEKTRTEKEDKSKSLIQTQTPRWLETHFWHKKRFHTETHWGYSLPIHHKARGKRFLHDAVKSSCVIHDSSYIRPIQILGTESAIQHLLRPFTVSYFIVFFLTFLLLCVSR